MSGLYEPIGTHRDGFTVYKHRNCDYPLKRTERSAFCLLTAEEELAWDEDAAFAEACVRERDELVQAVNTELW